MEKENLRRSNAVRCIEDNLEFNSYIEAAKHYGISPDSVSISVTTEPHRKIRKAGYISFEDVNDRKYRYKVPVRCVEDNVDFESMLFASQHYDVTVQAIAASVKEGRKMRSINKTFEVI